MRKMLLNLGLFFFLLQNTICLAAANTNQPHDTDRFYKQLRTAVHLKDTRNVKSLLL